MHNPIPEVFREDSAFIELSPGFDGSAHLLIFPVASVPLGFGLQFCLLGGPSYPPAPFGKSLPENPVSFCGAVDGAFPHSGPLEL